MWISRCKEGRKILIKIFLSKEWLIKMLTDKITRHQAKDTGMAMVLICLLVMAVSGRDFMLFPAIALLVVNMTVPMVFKPVARVWFGFSHFLGSIVSKVLLTVLFFTIVTPMGLIRRMTGADSLRLKEWGRGTKTAFTERNKRYSPEDLEHPY